ncbi:hypothetical protein EGR_03005 [Echinococcus granulosus]|uniref:Uncharacterized protein n=1 Tax=Echinococcus granulosus TaxID=6210 RepID=W6UMF8_ECHGR|nr:hypothetical protein EGR_03005 [Echinococcus granulosus]EUB62253.1 hypothetical protein EGR_03005 [Echinococcus granulosus]
MLFALQGHANLLKNILFDLSSISFCGEMDLVDILYVLFGNKVNYKDLDCVPNTEAWVLSLYQSSLPPINVPFLLTIYSTIKPP